MDHAEGLTLASLWIDDENVLQCFVLLNEL
jgi:hypothetical protein